MKIKSIIAGLLLSAVAANASVTMSGASLLNSAINGAFTGVYIASDSNSFDYSIINNLVADISFTQGTTIGDYTVLGTGAIGAAGPFSALMAGITYNLGGNVSTGNEIGILVFHSPIMYPNMGGTISVYTNDWFVPADGSNLSLTGGGPFTGAAALTSTIVPEPSAYALLGGLLALGCVMLRRRA